MQRREQHAHAAWRPAADDGEKDTTIVQFGDRRYGAFGLLALVVVLVGPGLRQEFFPEVDAGAFEIFVRAPSGTRVEETEERVARVEEYVKEKIGGDLELVISEIGLTANVPTPPLSALDPPPTNVGQTPQSSVTSSGRVTGSSPFAGRTVNATLVEPAGGVNVNSPL